MKKLSFIFAFVLLAGLSIIAQTESKASNKIPKELPGGIRPDQIFSGQTEISSSATTPWPPTGSAIMGASGFRPLEEENPWPTIIILGGLILILLYRYIQIFKEEKANRGEDEKPSVPLPLGIITDEELQGKYSVECVNGDILPVFVQNETMSPIVDGFYTVENVNGEILPAFVSDPVTESEETDLDYFGLNAYQSGTTRGHRFHGKRHRHSDII